MKPHMHGIPRAPELSPPARGAWIETVASPDSVVVALSPPARGAWIETWPLAAHLPIRPVAPRAGGVD